MADDKDIRLGMSAPGVAQPADGGESSFAESSVGQPGGGRHFRRYQHAGVFLLYLAIVVAYQWLSKAYTVAFGGYPDEPAHYMTALMIRDYILSGFSGSPLAFAERYYVHYPAIAFGMWGPVFHVLEAVWMLVFSESRISIMLLIALLAAGFAWSMYWLVARSFGRIPGVLAGLALCAVPTFVTYSAAVLADFLTATFILWAAYCWSRYLETGRTAMCVRFGVVASLALLTKVNAGVLALLPIPATLLAGRANLLRRREFWIPAAIVLAVTGPWYVFNTWVVWNIGTVPLTWGISLAYLRSGLGVFGVATIPLVVAGIAAGFFNNPKVKIPRPLWAVAVSMSLGFIVYYSLLPGGFEPRYLLPAAPWAAMLLLWGGEWIFTALLPYRRSVILAGLALAVAVYGAAGFRITPKTNLPYAEVARDLLPKRDLPPSIFMISSEAAVETVFVAEVAMRDRRPNHFVLRAAKMLARMTWNERRYETRVSNEGQVRDILHRLGVSTIIIDTTMGVRRWPHHRLLKNLVSTDPEWRLTRQYGAVEVYEFQGIPKVPESIAVEVPYTLRRTLVAPRSGN